MQRLFRRVAVVSALLVGLYACSSGLEVETPVPADAGPTDDGSVGVDGPGTDSTVVDDSGVDAATDAPTDGTTVDSADAGDGAPPGTPAIRFVGRRDTTDPAKPKFSWAGGRIIARFTGGTEVKVTFDESPITDTSRWEVLLDGNVTSTLALTAGLGTYTIATVNGAEHVIELYKRTEASVSSTQFIGLELVGGTLLAPPATLNRRIEFLGDSISNGYGNECVDPNVGFSAATENERLAFTGLTAHDLSADHHNVSFSGKGVFLNYTRSDTVVLPALYPRLSPTNPAGAGNLWAFADYTPDVVWINLGTNDWAKENAAASAPDLAMFTQKYIDLVTFIRSNYANAHIFMSLPASINDGFPAGFMALTKMRTALADVMSNRVAAGDAKIYTYEFTRDGVLLGCDYHPDLAAQRRLADQAIVQIKAKTLWP